MLLNITARAHIETGDPDDYSKAIADNVVYLRKIQGLSRIDLAKRADLTVSTIRSIEIRRGSPRVETLSYIAAALGVKVSYLLIEHRSEVDG